jgi:hypothetical protein
MDFIYLPLQEEILIGFCKFCSEIQLLAVPYSNQSTRTEAALIDEHETGTS